MSNLSITLSADDQAFVAEQLAHGNFSSPSDYIASLVEEARRRSVRQRFDALLLEGLDSGPSSEATPEYWQRVKAELSQKYDRADKP